MMRPGIGWRGEIWCRTEGMEWAMGIEPKRGLSKTLSPSAASGNWAPLRVTCV